MAAGVWYTGVMSTNRPTPDMRPTESDILIDLNRIDGIEQEDEQTDGEE